MNRLVLLIFLLVIVLGSLILNNQASVTAVKAYNPSNLLAIPVSKY